LATGRFPLTSEKNPSPRRLSFIASLLSSAASSVIVWLVGRQSLDILPATVLIFLLTFVFTFIVFNSLLKYFIYRKIKLIYKTIATAKDSKSSALKKIELDEDILGNVGRDVQEWKDNRSKEIAELKKMESFRKEFLGNVSHELKTPLFNIQGYIHTLLDGALSDPQVNVNYLQRAARSAERLVMIVDDLEEISKLESGQLVLDQRIFDLHELVEDVFESVELRANEMKITTAFKESGDRQVYVIADKDRIRQVITNLVTNSIKYGKRGGSTLVGFYDMDENILVEITDNGIGMDIEHLPRIFERFYRVDKSRSREQGGTGLGLSIVKHIIEAHGQNINVRSTIGIGTTFTFTLTKSK
jgi:two-component system, OmpR family, phosphate regulon sensor histidine kinase PhoR